MKKTLLAAIALTGLVGFTSAKAAYSANDGDVFLGIRDTAGTSAYVIDLGSMDNFANGGARSLISGAGAISLNSDLTSLIGGNWYNSPTVVMGLIGGFGDASGNSTAFSSAGVAILMGNPLLATLGNKADQQANNLSTIVGNISAPAAETDAVSGLNAYIVANATGASYASYQLNGPKNSFNLFGAAAYQGLYSADLETGVGNTLYLDSVFSTTTGGGYASSVLGALTVDSSGNVSVSAVPEPSTYVLMGLGALLLMIAYRRKTA